MRATLPALVLLVLAGPDAGGAQDARPALSGAPPATTSAGDGTLAQEGGVEGLAFLAGCWEGDFGGLRMLEEWTAPAGGVMLGTTRYLREGRVVDWEFARLFEDGDGGVVLWPHPKGVASPRGFPLVRLDTEAVFENLEHDFPVRIVYAREGPDRLTPRIEGRDGSGRGWALRRVRCPGG